MKKIFKSFLNHSRQSTALFIELVIVTIIGWIVIEPVAVNTSLALIPTGYDHDKIVSMIFSNFDYQSEEYDSTLHDSKSEKERLLTRIREIPEVESATYTSYQSFESGSSSSTGFKADSIYGLQGDDNWCSAYIIQYMPNTDFFTTFGIKDANGMPFNEPEVDSRSYIVSKTLAKTRYANNNALGQDLYERSENLDYATPIVGITEDALYRKSSARVAVMFAPIKDTNFDISLNGVALRLRDGVNARTFIDRLTSDISKYRIGNTYLTHPVLMTDKSNENFQKQSRDLAKGWIVLAFFLANVILGVAGTFYIQSRSRAASSGVMRAFGATRRQVQWQIVGEALILVVIAWALGSLLYMGYIIIADVELVAYSEKIVRIVNPMWFDKALSRYGIVGGVVLILLLLVSLFGVWFPARKISRVSPVDALRDE